ncbi:MAG: 4-hydroxybenzoate octaprenyltransferase [Pelagibacterales bacterium]|nr:4-hydroxybenzoate octaprenyltransferase [Pelagibacterales bacterium]
MRSIGCIWNDLSDKKIDILVKRTSKRLIANGIVTKSEAIIFIFINFLLGSIPLFFISKFSIALCLIALPLIVSYPFMKRITWWPQLWLGINFNWGVFVGYYALTNFNADYSLLLFYFGCIFWTIAYDTLYGFQDIKDDEKIGVKSTSIKFKKTPKVFLISNYMMCFVFWIISFSIIMVDILFLLLFCILFLSIIIITIKTKLNDPLSCENSFKYNSYFGFFTSLLLIYWNIILT